MVLSQHQRKTSGRLPYDLANKVLNRLPPVYRQSFTVEQIEALHTAMVMQNALEQDGPRQIPLWKAHVGPFDVSIDLRSRRGLSGSKAPSQKKLVPVLCVMMAMLGAGAVAGLLKFRHEYHSGLATAAQTQKQLLYPITLPSHKDQTTCEEIGSVWVDQECVSYDYSPMF